MDELPDHVSLHPEDLAPLHALLARLADTHPDRESVFTLRLAETGLNALRRTLPPVPAAAVVGPTQTGKSTVANILAGGAYMETSPLAAHTRRASVLAMGPAPGPELSVELRALGLPVEPRSAAAAGPACLIWDTPDFDSNAAAVYRQQVARVCALADLIVLVVSKEKYADQAVWGVLESVARMGTPVIVCLNKCDAGPDTALVLDALERRLADNPAVPADTVVLTLPTLAADTFDASPMRPELVSFRAGVFQDLAPRSTHSRQAGLAREIRAQWAVWTAPVERELACRREWLELLAEQTRSFLARYRVEYIDHAKHYDVARKAILGLLELLEVPALAGPMTRTRRALTWPFRKLAASVTRPAATPRDKEQEVLDAAVDHYLLSLRGEVAARGEPWWRALDAELAERAPPVKRAFHQSVEAYRRAFQPRIDELSTQLYERLKRSPATLNALRATRLGADAGGIVFAFKTGTLGLYDALFAPAMISLTSYLTESVVGRYLGHVIEGLKREQYEQVDRIIRETVEAPLGSLQPRGPGLFGVADDELARARRGLEALEQ